MAILFFVLFIVPFIVAPFGGTHFETPKVLVFEASIICFFIYKIFSGKIVSPKLSMQHLIFLGIVLLSLLHIFLFRTNISFFGNETRLQGIFLLWCLLMFAVLSSTLSLKIKSWKIFASFLIFHLIILFFSLVTADNRYVGTLGEPNAMGAYVLFLWPFVFFSFKKFKIVERLASVAMFFLIILSLLLTHSRSAMIGFFLQVLCIMLVQFRLSLKKTFFVCLAFYCLSYLLPFFAQTPFENRVDIWKTAVFAGMHSPLVGNGFGNTEIALEKTAKKYYIETQDSYVDSAHNLFLDWWVQGGIIGLGSIFALIFLSFKTFIKEKLLKEIVLFLGLLTALSFNPASIVGLIGFWWLIGRGWQNKQIKEI